MKKLYVDNLSFAYGKAENIVENIHLEVEEGTFVGIIGSNGSGKSTILKNIYGGLHPKTGTIKINGVDVKELRGKKLALQLAVVGQENSVPFNFTVREIVAMGRTPHKKLFEPDTKEDREIVEEAMERVGIKNLAEREFSSLSGGEKQRVLIARALAQKTDFLILDEPTNHLDICYQLQIFEILKKSGLTVLAVIHDLNLASCFCDELYVLHGKSIAYRGKTEDMISEELIREVFHVDCNVSFSPHTGRKSIVFIPKTYKKREVV